MTSTTHRNFTEAAAFVEGYVDCLEGTDQNVYAILQFWSICHLNYLLTYLLHGTESFLRS